MALQLQKAKKIDLSEYNILQTVGTGIYIN